MLTNIIIYKGVEITFHTYFDCYLVYEREFSTLSAAKSFVTRQNKRDKLLRNSLKVIQGERFYKGFSIAKLKRVI